MLPFPPSKRRSLDRSCISWRWGWSLKPCMAPREFPKPPKVPMKPFSQLAKVFPFSRVFLTLFDNEGKIPTDQSLLPRARRFARRALVAPFGRRKPTPPTCSPAMSPDLHCHRFPNQMQTVFHFVVSNLFTKKNSRQRALTTFCIPPQHNVPDAPTALNASPRQLQWQRPNCDERPTLRIGGGGL